MAMRVIVSTHSRAEAAAAISTSFLPEQMFQHTAARRRLHAQKLEALRTQAVSTHSRAEAAAASGLN